MWIKKITLALLGILVAGQWLAAEEGRSKQDGYAPKSYETATMGAGASYSSPMSTDRKTIIKTRDGVVWAEEIYSLNKMYYAYADFGSDTTTVFEVRLTGKTGQTRKLWTMSGCFEMLGLTNDGRVLVLGNKSDNLIADSKSGDLVMLTFIDSGKPAGRIKLDQMIDDLQNLPKVGEHYYWGDYWGLNESGHYVVQTAEGRQIQFDARTGKMLVSKAAVSTPPPGWLLYNDVMRGYEYMYPGDYNFKENRNHEGRPTGETSVSNAITGWTAHVSVEHYARSSRRLQNPPTVPFETFVVERARLMNSADGPDSSRYATDVLKLESYQTGNGLKCVEFYLLGVHESHYEGENSRIENKTLGPFYAVQLSGEEEPYRALFLSSTGWGEAPPDEDNVLKRMVDTVRLIHP